VRHIWWQETSLVLTTSPTRRGLSWKCSRLEEESRSCWYQFNGVYVLVAQVYRVSATRRGCDRREQEAKFWCGGMSRETAESLGMELSLRGALDRPTYPSPLRMSPLTSHHLDLHSFTHQGSSLPPFRDSPQLFVSAAFFSP
jgi:hypothetical protein